jgi:hypothetical protein
MTRRLLAIVVLLGGLAAAHLAFVQPWFMQWGATVREMHAVWPGDELSAHAESVATRAVTIDAPADKVWPWIVQLGQERAGWYSYRLLENLVGCQMPRVHHIVAGFQERRVGDKIWMYPADRLGGVGHGVVVRLDPERALVMATVPIGSIQQAPEATLSFLLDPIDGATTRFIMRSRGPAPVSRGQWLFDRLAFRPLHYVMERRMMLTIKALAEGHDPSEVPDLLQAGLWLVLGLLAAGSLVAALFVARWRRPLAVVLTGATALSIAMLAQPPVVVTGVLVGAVIGLALPWTPFREDLNAA